MANIIGTIGINMRLMHNYNVLSVVMIYQFNYFG
jgi:hypothetical protein